MQSLKFICKSACLLTCFFSICLTTHVYSQCTGGNSINLPKYKSFQVVKDFRFTGIRELSGMTYVDGGEFVLISDDRTTSNGVATGEFASFNDMNITKVFTINNVDTGGCADFEAITYIDTDPNNPNLHRLAFSEERQRQIAILSVDLSGPTTVNYPAPSDVINLAGIPGIPANGCGANNGIEGLAYDPNSGRMYLGLETGQIYYFDLTSANPASVTPTLLIDLAMTDIVAFSSFSGMDILPNGNLLLLSTINNNNYNDSGSYDRRLVEVDPCGCVISQLDLNTITGLENDELEGIAYRMGNLYIVGEDGFMYRLITNTSVPILTVNSPLASSSLVVESGFQIQWSIVPNFNQGQITIELFRENEQIHTFTTGTANDGSFSAVLPSVNIAPIGSEYRIRVTSNSDATITAFSAYFQISDMNCVDNLTINTNAGTSDNQQAELTITANNVVGINSTALYHAGEEVLLTDGFVAESGSTFRAYVEGCSDVFEELQSEASRK